jgi:pimeloyl-ACP methyl ester carboxylesterase
VQLNHHRSGTGEPLVLIHGIGSRWQVWDPVLAALTEQREVIALDLPGFGASSMPPPGTPAGIESLTGIVDEFIFAELGLDRPHVAGNSLGGWIAIELAKRGRVRSATALSPAGFFAGVDRLYARASLRATLRLARLLDPRADRVTASVLGRRLVFAQVVARPERVSAVDAADSLRALARAPWFDDSLRALVRERFTDGEQIGVPVTIAWGEKDRLLPPRQARRAAALIPSARLVTLTGCGHLPTYDDPAQVAGVLLAGSSLAVEPVAA